MHDFKIIRNLIAEKQQLIAVRVIRPHDVASIKQHILQFELATELDHLSILLQTPETFADNFKQRCIDRATTHSIGINQIPLSGTNYLYWQIAMLVFKPSTMAEMLAILTPQITAHLQISHSELITNSLKETVAKGLEPVFVFKDNLSALSEPPAFSLLSDFVFSDETLIDLRDIERFPLRTHAKLFEGLSTLPPSLCEQIYNHNYAFKTLKDDIAILNNNGITPKEALELLIKGLILGGQEMTGTQYATAPAVEATSRFMSFMEDLPSKVQADLRKAQGDIDTLGKIIDDELKKGTCVETAAEHLRQILDANKNLPLFNLPSRISPQGLKQLERKYKRPLSLQKEDPLLKNLPIEFLRQALQDIKLECLIDLVDLLMHLPPSLYDELLTNIRLVEAEDTFNTIADLIKQGFLSSEQSDELAKVSIHYYKFDFIQGLLWAIKTNKSAYVTTALAFIPQEVNLAIDHIITILSSAVREPESFTTILHYILKQNQLTAVEVRALCSPALPLAILNPSSLRTILSLYSEQERLMIFQENKHLLHEAVFNFESINTIFELLPASDRLLALNIIYCTDTLLHSAATYPNSIKILLSLYPAQERLAAIKVLNDKGNSVLHLAALNIDSLQPVLNLYPEEEKLAAIQLQNNDGQTVLHKAAIHPDTIKFILELYPEQDRLAAILQEDNAQNTPVGLSLYFPEQFPALLSQIPITQWAELFRNINDPGCEESFKLIGMHNLYRKIALLKNHVAKSRGEITEKLAEDLELKLSLFLKECIENLPNEAKVQQFKKEFIDLANSQNTELHKHHEIWGPILLNILIALTGVGLVAIVSNIIYQAAKGYSDFNHLLFFAKTTSQELEEDIEADLHLRLPIK